MPVHIPRSRPKNSWLSWKVALLGIAVLATALFPATADAAVTCKGKTVTINMNTNGGNGNGTPGNDVILGTPSADTIRGGSGVDTICGGNGNDLIYGDGGSDRIRGEGGHDTIHAGSGADDVWGGSGNDTINGNGGQDDIWGEAGNDVIQGNHQSDKLYGGDGDDRVAGADGKDRLYGEAGNDELFGGNNTDYLYGGADDDKLNGQAGSDTADGGTGSDDCVNTETETNCGPTSLPDFSPPYWTDPTSTLVLTTIGRWDFTISLPQISGVDHATFYEIETTADDGTVHLDHVPWHNETYEFNTFKISFAAGDSLTMRVTAIDARGNRSPTLEIFPIVIPGRVTISSEQLDFLDVNGNVISSVRTANACPGDSHCSGSGVISVPSGTDCFTLTTVSKMDQFLFSDNHGTFVTKACKHDSTQFQTVAASSICTDGLRFRSDDSYPAAQTTTAQTQLPSRSVFAEFTCLFDGTEPNFGGTATRGEAVLTSGTATNDIRLNGGSFIVNRHDFVLNVTGTSGTWTRDTINP